MLVYEVVLRTKKCSSNLVFSFSYFGISFLCAPSLTVFLAKYLPGPDAKTTKNGSSSPALDCCSDAACKGGEGGVKVVGSMQEWEDLKRWGQRQQQ